MSDVYFEKPVCKTLELQHEYKYVDNKSYHYPVLAKESYDLIGCLSQFIAYAVVFRQGIVIVKVILESLLFTFSSHD